MADRDFVVKNGLVVNTNLIFANGTSKFVGINNTTPDAELAVTGSANVSGNVALGANLAVSGGITTSSNVAVGANVLVNTSVFLMGNSTVNSVQNSTVFAVSNSSTSSNLTSSDLKIGVAVVNTSTVAVGANARINASALYIGNSTANVVANSTSVFVGNSSVNVLANSSTIIFNNFSVVNSTTFSGTSNNSTNFAGQPQSYYANAENLTSGTLSNARLAPQVVNTSGNFTLSGNITLTGTNTAISSNVNVTGTFLNVASAFVVNSTGAYHTGTVNAASHTIGANIVANTSGVNFVGNTTTSPSISLANTGALLIGNSTTTQTLSIISVANSSGSANITAAGFSGNGHNLKINASNVDSGTLAWAQAPTGTVNTSGNFTLSGNTTLAGANTVVSGNLNVTGTFLNVASAFIANSTGAYHTGVVNATTHSSGATFTANSTLVNAAAINVTGQVNTTTLYAATSANIASAVQANATGVWTTGQVNAASHTVGTTFVANLTTLRSDGVVVNSSGGFFGGYVNASGFSTITGNANAVNFYAGANLLINSTSIAWTGNTTTSPSISLANTGALLIGNSSTTQTTSLISVANSTGSANISPTGFSGNGYNLKINASNVDSGTLVSARLSGSYTGITSVGTLGTVTVSGNSSLTNGLVAFNTNASNANTVSFGAANASFDSGVLFVDAINNRIGVKNTTPDAELTVTGSANISGSLTVNGNLIISGNTISAGTTEYSGNLTPQSNGFNLGNNTNRWVVVGINADFNGNVVISSNLYLNSTSISYVGNTTTSPTITIANTGVVTIGNGSTTQTTSLISIANSTGSANISPSGFSGNGYNITSINATSLSNGTVPSARISGSYTGITGVGTLAGVTVSGNANFDSGVLFVDGTNNRVGVNTSSPSVTLQVASNDAIFVPIGTTAQRPTGANGMVRYNVNTDIFEGYSGGSWKPVSETNGGYYKGNNGAAGNTNNKANLFRINANTQSNNITISAGENAMAAGPLTVSLGYTLTIEPGGRVVIV